MARSKNQNCENRKRFQNELKTKKKNIKAQQ